MKYSANHCNEHISMEKRNIEINRRGRLIAPGGGGKGPVIYWMSRDQRVDDNWALLWAQQEALVHARALMVVFCLVPDYPGANLRHYGFMLRPLKQLQERLHAHRIAFLMLEGDPVERLAALVKEQDARSLVYDFDPLKIKRRWQRQLIAKINIPLYEVDAHNIIPVWITSEKKEYAAYTIRPKINRLLDDYLTTIPALQKHPYPCPSIPAEIDCKHLLETVSDKSVSEVSWLSPGEEAAQEAAAAFIERRLGSYDEQRNNPCLDGQSGLSPYLHFGQLSAQRVALMARGSNWTAEEQAAFIEELVVRRELADNFCYYEKDYDRFNGFPAWAQKSLNEHRADKRTYCYALAELEAGATHEPLWNACQQDLVQTGKLHGYLRMYWAKKILEWTSEPEQALDYAVLLNDRYSLDGRDPNGYTGIAWSIGGVHDRAWPERAIFGKIRYMNANGCRRKFDVNRYISEVKDKRDCTGQAVNLDQDISGPLLD
jgi:deoxyribodipyrimidine photo-lyase